MSAPAHTPKDGDLALSGFVSSVKYDEEEMVAADDGCFVFVEDDKGKEKQIIIRGLDWSPCVASVFRMWMSHRTASLHFSQEALEKMSITYMGDAKVLKISSTSVERASFHKYKVQGKELVKIYL